MTTDNDYTDPVTRSAFEMGQRDGSYGLERFHAPPGMSDTPQEIAEAYNRGYDAGAANPVDVTSEDAARA
jgi:hypothetical protein